MSCIQNDKLLCVVVSPMDTADTDPRMRNNTSSSSIFSITLEGYLQQTLVIKFYHMVSQEIKQVRNNMYFKTAKKITQPEA